jgi:hypothetical protein
LSFCFGRIHAPAAHGPGFPLLYFFAGKTRKKIYRFNPLRGNKPALFSVKPAAIFCNVKLLMPH